GSLGPEGARRAAGRGPFERGPDRVGTGGPNGRVEHRLLRRSRDRRSHRVAGDGCCARAYERGPPVTATTFAPDQGLVRRLRSLFASGLTAATSEEQRSNRQRIDGDSPDGNTIETIADHVASYAL